MSLVVAAYFVALVWLITKHEESSQMAGNFAKKVDAGRSTHKDNFVHADDGKITIGVASTVTGCGSDPFVDGAAVLKYSFDVHSKSEGSKFKYKHYIMYHPDARECVLPLEALGYTLLERPTPIKVEDIRGDGGLRERIVTNGCCGEVSDMNHPDSSIGLL